MARGGGEQDRDDFVLNETQPFGAAPPVTILQEHGLRGRTRRDQLGLHQARPGGAKYILASGLFCGKRVDRAWVSRWIATFAAPRAGVSPRAVQNQPRA